MVRLSSLCHVATKAPWRPWPQFPGHPITWVTHAGLMGITQHHFHFSLRGPPTRPHSAYRRWGEGYGDSPGESEGRSPRCAPGSGSRGSGSRTRQRDSDRCGQGAGARTSAAFRHAPEYSPAFCSAMFSQIAPEPHVTSRLPPFSHITASGQEGNSTQTPSVQPRGLHESCPHPGPYVQGAAPGQQPRPPPRYQQGLRSFREADFTRTGRRFIEQPAHYMTSQRFPL